MRAALLAVLLCLSASALETGTHRFYAIQKGKPDRLTETGQFTQVWKEENGQWRLALSYDHQLAE